jgi:hypothetical protein
MAEPSLYDFEGPDLVREFLFRRSGDRSWLTVTFRTAGGDRRVLFANPRPLTVLLAIVNAEQVWVREETDDLLADAGPIRVEFWWEEFFQFSADSAVDLDASPYETLPETPVEELGVESRSNRARPTADADRGED